MPGTRIRIKDLLAEAAVRGCSDLHLVPGFPPAVRLNGALVRLGEEEIGAEEVLEIAAELMDERRRAIFEERRQVDFSFSIPEVGRFRVNAYRQRGSVGLAIRLLPSAPPRLEELRLPPAVRKLCEKARGLILLAGPTGSGKSTTLAAMVDRINEEREVMVVTLEDPMEYLHRHKRSIVVQREIGEDAPSFGEALAAAMREDPDVIVIGELRDPETVVTGIRAAETGHLVLASVHAPDAVGAFERILGFFEPEQQGTVRLNLARVFEGVIGQVLVPTVDGERVPCAEVILRADATRSLIRTGDFQALKSVVENHRAAGMQSMEQSAAEWVRKGVVSEEEVRRYGLDLWLGGSGTKAR